MHSMFTSKATQSPVYILAVQVLCLRGGEQEQRFHVPRKTHSRRILWLGHWITDIRIAKRRMVYEVVTVEEA